MENQISSSEAPTVRHLEAQPIHWGPRRTSFCRIGRRDRPTHGPSHSPIHRCTRSEIEGEHVRTFDGQAVGAGNVVPVVGTSAAKRQTEENEITCIFVFPHTAAKVPSGIKSSYIDGRTRLPSAKKTGGDRRRQLWGSSLSIVLGRGHQSHPSECFLEISKRNSGGGSLETSGKRTKTVSSDRYESGKV